MVISDRPKKMESDAGLGISLVVVGFVLWMLAMLISTNNNGCNCDNLPVADTVHATVDDDTVRRSAVLHFAERFDVDERKALAVSYAENWSGDPDAVSSAGAIGIMQVMPFWEGHFKECWAPVTLAPDGLLVYVPDLNDPHDNACHGVLILRAYGWECGGDWFCTLRKYNGARTRHKAVTYYDDVNRRMAEVL